MSKEINFTFLADSTTIKVFKFDWDDIKMNRIPKTQRPDPIPISILQTKEANSSRFIEWVIRCMESVSSNDVKAKIGTTKRFKSQALFMNEHNRALLHERVLVTDYLNWGPSLCDLLADDEYGIEMNNMLRSIEDGETG